MWSEYNVKVKSYSLDAEVKFIRLLGVSPETEPQEIKQAFREAGIGETVEIKKGFLVSFMEKVHFLSVFCSPQTTLVLLGMILV